MSTVSNVATPSAEVLAMRSRAEVIRTLMGGTRAMREASRKYLPQLAAEGARAYAARVEQSTLFNATRKTVRDMTGKVFAKPVVLGGDVPVQLRAFAENVDLTGRHLSIFARDVFFDALQTGIGYLLADMPPLSIDQPNTIAAEKAQNRRPYLVYIPLENVLGWKSTLQNGAEVLTQFRFKETVFEPNGEWLEKTVTQVRVLSPGAWEVWREASNNAWVKVAEGVTSLDRIAITPVYLDRTGFMQAEPPLSELAELNVAHWQSSSDQRNILHVARVPILFGSGFSDESTIEVGANSMVRAQDPNANLRYVEHSGHAIGAGREDLKDLEFQMQTMGLQLLVPNPGQTATGEIRDDAKENSPLAAMASGLQDALEAAFGFMAAFIGLGNDAGGSLTINTDFGVQAGAGADLQQLLDAVNSRQISRETFWSEWKRRGILSDSFDPAVEKDRLASAPPELDGAPLQ